MCHTIFFKGLYFFTMCWGRFSPELELIVRHIIDVPYVANNKLNVVVGNEQYMCLRKNWTNKIKTKCQLIKC